MSDQLIITISREFGSGGLDISKILAEKFNLPLYDKKLLYEVANEKHVDVANLEKYDEVPKKFFRSRTVRGYSSSPEENIAALQFDYLRKKAASGESFIVVGRCAGAVLEDTEHLIKIFIFADDDYKLNRLVDKFDISKEDAFLQMKRMDNKRKTYHNYYCATKWGDAHNYDLCIDSSSLGTPGTADFLESYILTRTKEWNIDLESLNK